MTGNTPGDAVRSARKTFEILKAAFYQGQVSEESARIAAQAYIDAIKAYSRTTKKRVPMPTVTKLMR